MSSASGPRYSLWALIFVLGFGALTLYLTAFSVHQTRYALVLQLGDPRRAIDVPGLHFKLPFIQNVVFIDRRILDLDLPAEEVIASDQKRLVVDAFLKYRIFEPLAFYITLNNARTASSRLGALLSSSMRSVLGKQPFEAVVRDRRAELMLEIRDLVNGQAQDFGIEVVDVRIRRADLPQANSQAIFRRMQTEREQEAAEIRAIGQQDAREIRAEAEKSVAVILAQAYRDAEILRGQGEGCRNRIFARAFGQDPEFFAFYRSMQSYERAFKDKESSLVLSPDTEFFRFFSDPDGKSKRASSGVSAPRKGGRPFREKDLRKALCPELPALIDVGAGGDGGESGAEK